MALNLCLCVVKVGLSALSALESDPLSRLLHGGAMLLRKGGVLSGQAFSLVERKTAVGEWQLHLCNRLFLLFFLLFIYLRGCVGG